MQPWAPRQLLLLLLLLLLVLRRLLLLLLLGMRVVLVVLHRVPARTGHAGGTIACLPAIAVQAAGCLLALTPKLLLRCKLGYLLARMLLCRLVAWCLSLP